MRIGLALGGGGAKGLAHVPILEAFDEAGIRPHMISGTSIGAIVGAMYAAGRTAADIRETVRELIPNTRDDFGAIWKKLGASKFSDFFGINFGSGAWLDTTRMEEFFARMFGARTFEELATPLRVVASDYWNRAEVVFESGDLLSAVRASMALPGIFTAVERDGRILVDGGGVNPLPFDLLRDDCDLVVAVDVSGQLVPGEDHRPGVLEALMGMYQIMSRSMVDARLKVSEPDLFLRPEIKDVRVLEFWKGPEIVEGAQDAKERCLQWLQDRAVT
ncbi:MAG: patatin-like phospholipase family protein [Planctomycetota bacterium]|jgi:NTE family protein